MSVLKVAVTAADHMQGDLNAGVILVEYGDYQCPHCGHAYPIVKRVQEHFGKKLAFVFRNFPLNEVHPSAQSAAEAAEFAGKQGKFWEMHDAIFENQELLDDDLLVALAENLGMSGEALTSAWEKEEFLPRVKGDFMSGARSGVNGTPTFFINGARHEGAFEYEDLVAGVEKAIAQVKGASH
ncbi:MAG TPA: thioredoxin domain-containing protein [Phycisphaerae bacterium]|jgi:protein-disulfide isomerase